MPKIRQNINPYQGSIEAIIRPNWDGDDGEMHNIFHVDAEDTTCVLHLKFDEGSGSTAYDSSIYGNNGTISGATWSSGVVGSGLSFDGVDDYVDCGADDELYIESDITICAWYKINALTSNYQDIVRKGFDFYWNGNYAKWAPDGDAGIATPMALGEYGFICGSVVGTSSAYLYKNGVLGNSGTNTLNAISTNLRIGKWVSLDTAPNAIIDEPMVFNRALSASEIKAIYENGRTGIGLAKGKDNYLGFLVPGVGVSYDVSTWTAGNTYHVVGSWDKDNAYLYINGSLVASGTRDTSAVVASVDNDIYVGNILGTVTADSYVHTRVYDVVLPATKSSASTQGLPQWMSVEGLYNSGDPIDAPVTEHVLFKYPTS